MKAIDVSSVENDSILRSMNLTCLKKYDVDFFF